MKYAIEIPDEVIKQLRESGKADDNEEFYPGEHEDVAKILRSYLIDDPAGPDEDEEEYYVLDNALKSGELRLMRRALVYCWGDLSPEYLKELLPPQLEAEHAHLN